MKESKCFSERQMNHIRNTLLEKTGVWIKKYYIAQALTRSSFSKQSGGQNNEALEFLGDSVIGFYVVKAIDQYYGMLINNGDDCGHALPMQIKELAKLKNTIVCNENLAAIMDEWDLAQYMIVGKSDLNNDVAGGMKIKADLLEAIIGAIAVQCQWNSQVLESVVEKVFSLKTYFKDYSGEIPQRKEYNLSNAIGQLKELFEHEQCSKPTYEFAGPDLIGYDDDGNPKWACTCKVTSWGSSTLVYASSKNTAKQCAAYLTLIERFNLPNLYGPRIYCPAWVKDEEGLHPFDYSK